MNFSTDLNFHRELIQLFARRINPEVYVELGLEAGTCISGVSPHSKRSIGVDINAPADTSAYEFFHGTTDDFFNSQLFSELEKIDMAFIDADHSHNRSLLDFEGLLPKVAPNGLIFLHDTFPENNSYLIQTLCYDSYKTADHIRQNMEKYGVEVITLPIPPGLTIVKKIGNVPYLP